MAPSGMLDLPVEILSNIGSKLLHFSSKGDTRQNDLYAWLSTCSTLYSLRDEPVMWKEIFEEQWDRPGDHRIIAPEFVNECKRRVQVLLTDRFAIKDGRSPKQEQFVLVLRNLIIDAYAKTGSAKNLRVLKSPVVLQRVLRYMFRTAASPQTIAIRFCLLPLTLHLAPQKQCEIFNHRAWSIDDCTFQLPHRRPLFITTTLGQRVDFGILSSFYQAVRWYDQSSLVQYDKVWSNNRTQGDPQRPMGGWTERLSHEGPVLSEGAYTMRFLAWDHDRLVALRHQARVSCHVEDCWNTNDAEAAPLDVDIQFDEEAYWPSAFESHTQALSHPAFEAINSFHKTRGTSNEAPHEAFPQNIARPTPYNGAYSGRTSQVPSPKARKFTAESIVTSSDVQGHWAARGYLIPALPQWGIPGWGRFSMVAAMTEDSLHQTANQNIEATSATLFDTDNTQYIAYEGVVIPGGTMVVGRWWVCDDPETDASDPELDCGPFVMWPKVAGH